MLRHAWTVLTAWLFVVLTTAGCGSGASDSEPTARHSPSPSATRTPSAQPSEGPVGSTYVFASEFEQDGEPTAVRARITVLDVRDRARPDDPDVAAFFLKRDERWVRVRVKIKNIGPDKWLDSTEVLTLADAKGQHFSEVGAIIFRPAIAGGIEVPAGKTDTGFMAFAVPKKVRLAAVEFTSPLIDDSYSWRVG